MTIRSPPPTGHDPQELSLKADAFAQLKLLDLQDHDSRLDLLRHRLSQLPEIGELAALGKERSGIDDSARDAKIRVDDLTREQRKADQDVEQVKTRLTRDQSRMDQGLISNPKDLERMQSELGSLARRIADLEDLELEVMEQLETAQGEHDALVAQLADIDLRGLELTRNRDAKIAEIEAEVTSINAERKTLAGGIAADLLALYEKIRAQKGVGAARLKARRCEGCSMQLTALDLERIAKAPMDEVLRCEECDRILVRTSESGI